MNSSLTSDHVDSRSPLLVRMRGVLLIMVTVLLAAGCGSSVSSTTTSTDAAQQEEARIENTDETRDDAAADRDSADETPNEGDSNGDSAETNDADDDSDSGDRGVDADAEAGDAIGDLLGIPIGDDDAMEAYFADVQRDTEESIARCMAAEGFEYTANNLNVFDTLDTELDRDSREYAETYGFGIASNEFDEFIDAFEDYTDPNEEYVESLSPGEAEAYQVALTGFTEEELIARFQDATTEDFDQFTPSGCQGEAFESSFALMSVFMAFGDEFEDLEDRVEADPRLVAARAGWSGCMGESGFRFDTEDDAASSIRERYQSIVSEGRLSSDSAVEPADPDSGIIELQSQSLSPELQAQVDELAKDEVALATASWDCSAEAREIERVVSIEAEQQFLDENGSAIRAMLDN